MTSFLEARYAVEREVGLTLEAGYEDDDDFNVLLVEPEADDQVNLVSKISGELHREPFWEVEDRLAKMTPVNSD